MKIPFKQTNKYCVQKVCAQMTRLKAHSLLDISKAEGQHWKGVEESQAITSVRVCSNYSPIWFHICLK